MKNRNDLLFVHGGPGMNCQPERSILSDSLSKNRFSFQFFDEPSKQRPNGPAFHDQRAYTNWLKALHLQFDQTRPRLVVACSFGALAMLHYLATFPEARESLQGLVMVSPTLDLNRVFHRMMEFSERDFAGGNSDQIAIGRKLSTLRASSQKLWDDPMRSALGLVWQNPHLLSRYSSVPAIQAGWTAAYSTPNYGLDFESQEAVLSDMARHPQVAASLATPIHVLYGVTDPVFDMASVREVLQTYAISQPAIECFSESGHFPHLEQPERFCQSLRTFLESLA